MAARASDLAEFSESLLSREWGAKGSFVRIRDAPSTSIQTGPVGLLRLLAAKWN